MAKQSSNTNLAFDELKEDVKAMRADVNEIKNWMNYEKGRQSNVKDSNGNINWSEIMKQLLVVMAVAGSIVLAVIQILAERVK